MDRARRPTLGFFSQNLHATHTNLAKSSGGPYVAAELRGDGPAVEHLATGTEAVNRRIARRLADDYCSPGQDVWLFERYVTLIIVSRVQLAVGLSVSVTCKL